MPDTEKSNEHLLDELQRLRRRVAELEQIEADYHKTAQAMRETQEKLRQADERRQTEMAKCRETEARYRDISEMISDFAYSHWVAPDGSTTLEWITDAFYQITGYDRAVLADPNGWDQLIYPADLSDAHQQFHKLLAGETISTEMRIVTKQSEVRWLQIYAKPVWDAAQSRVVRLYGAAQDITERKQAEHHLQEGEAKFRILAETTAAATVIFRDKFIYANPTMEAISGYSLRELQTMSFWELVHPDFQNVAKKNGVALLHGESIQTEYEVKILTKAGQIRWLHFTGGLIIFEGEQTVIGTAFDITDRKRVEDALERMNQRYRTLFDEAPAMYVINRKQEDTPIIVDANEQFLTTLGYSWSEVYEQSMAKFYSKKSYKQLMAGGYERALEGDFLAEERELVTREGRTIQTLLRAMPETDSTGRVIGTRAMYIDITQSKQLQERLAAIHQLSRELTLLRDEGEIAQQVLKTAQLVLRCQYIACGLINQMTNSLKLRYQIAADVVQPIEVTLPMTGSDLNGITVVVAQTGQALNVSDVRQDPRYIDPCLEWTGGSELCVPLKIGERVIGVLNAESVQRNHFTADDQRILQILADQAAVALENAWLHAETEWRTKELAALHNAGRVMASSLDLNTVMEQALAEIKELLAAEGASLLLLDPMNDDLVFAAAASPGAESMIGLRLPLTTGIAGWAATQKMSILIEDAQQDDRFYESVDEATGLTTRSLIAVPLIGKERVVGVIESINKAEGRFNQADLELLEALASSAVIAIENARLHSETQQRLQVQTALRETAMIISSTLNLNAVLHRIAEQMCRLVDVTSVYISRYEPTAPAVIPIAEYISDQAHPREQESDISVVYSIKKDFKELLVALETGQHLVTHADDPHLSPARRRHLQHYAAQTVLDIPMRVGGRTIACATLWESRQTRHFTFDEINFCHDLAQHAAIAMENAGLHTETEQRLAAQTTLRKAVEAIFASLDMAEVLQQISRQIGEAVAATSVSLYSYDPKQRQTTVLAEYISPHASLPEQERGLGLSCNLQPDFPTILDYLGRGEPWLVHSDDLSLTPAEIEYARQFGLKTVLLIPLKLRGQLIAFAEIRESRRKRDFSPTEIGLSQDIAQQAVVAIENARLHAETERRANQLSVLHELDQAITASLDIQEVYKAFARHSIRLIAYDRLSITLIEGEQLRLVYTVDPEGTGLETGTLLPLAGSAAEYVIGHGQVLVRQDISQDQRFVEDEVLIAKQIRAGVVLPLRNKGRVIGTWNMGTYRTYIYNLDDVQIAQSMADQLAIAIENIQLLESETIQRQRTEALQAAGAAISSTLDLNQVLDHLLVELGKVVPYDSASVFLLEEDILRITMARSLPDPSPIGQRFELNELARIVEQTRRPLILADARQDSRFQRWEGAKHVRGWMNVPLIARDTFIGHITLDSRQPAAFSRTDADLALSFANQAAMAVENARLFQNLQNQMHILEETQGQLIQTESMAALGRLSASIAHEINNPLQAIQSGLLLFKDRMYPELADERLRHYLEVAEQEIDRISAIMHRMRNFYPSANKSQPTSPPSLDLLSDFYHSAQQDLQSVDLHIILKDGLNLIEKHLHHKSVTARCQWTPNLPSIQGNPDHLQQVFLNLMMNALEAMAAQGGSLFLTTALAQIEGSDAQTRPAVRVEISDTGPGIAAEQLPHLFEQFYSTKESGSGLGLFISSKIIEAHNGHITVESRPGLGTTFFVLLPLEQS